MGTLTFLVGGVNTLSWPLSDDENAGIGAEWCSDHNRRMALAVEREACLAGLAE